MASSNKSARLGTSGIEGGREGERGGSECVCVKEIALAHRFTLTLCSSDPPPLVKGVKILLQMLKLDGASITC